MLYDAKGFEKIYIAPGYTDLRKGLDGLAMIIGMANWMITCGERYLSLIYDLLHQKLLDETVVQADETKVKVSKNEDPGRKDSHMWLFRTGEYNTETPVVLYDFQNSRAGKNACNFLDGFSGVVECDGYSGYRFMDRTDENISIACCWAHARRRFADR